MDFETPILLLICNRPKETKIVFNKIRELKPKTLYISQDGNDIEVRKAIKIDWHCDFHFRQSEERQGCKNGVLAGINWFFKNVPEGIILEDDIVPNKAFFWFCYRMLDEYRNDKRIFHINGSNFHETKWIGTHEYYFSQNVHSWGWASWADRWKNYTANFDYNLIPKSHKHLIKYLKQIESGKLDTWDYQWAYTVLINNGIVIAPNLNMCINIGFNERATHTKNSDYHKPREYTYHLTPMEIEYEADKREIRNNKIKKYRDLIYSIIA